MVRRIGRWIWAAVAAVGLLIAWLLGFRRANEEARIDEADTKADDERKRLRDAAGKGDAAVLDEWRRHRR